MPKLPFWRKGFRILVILVKKHCECDRRCSDGPHLRVSLITVEMVGECFDREGLLAGVERTLDCTELATFLMALQCVRQGFMLTPSLLENKIN